MIPTWEQPLKAWLREAEAATWKTPADVKARYASASILKSGRVVFNIGGNNYRLVAKVMRPSTDELEVLSTLVESYERVHYPIEPPDPIDAILFRMEQSGHAQPRI